MIADMWNWDEKDSLKNEPFFKKTYYLLTDFVGFIL